MNEHFKLILFIAVTLFSCSTRQNYLTNKQNALDICDLPDYRDKKVRLIASYSGVDEYWSLNSILNKKCANDTGIDLDFDDKYELPNNFEYLMEKVHNTYWKSYLLIDVIGIFETGNKNGYGHLGHNKSCFKVVEVLDMKLYKKRK